MDEAAFQSPSHESGDHSDHELLAAVRAGRSAALDLLLDRYWSAQVLYAARLLGSRDSAEDIAQETFVRLWERREEWSQHGSVRALLYQITRNLALDERKRRERRAVWLRAYRAVPAVVLTPLDDVQEGELETAYRAAVEALPERRREVFLLARVDGLSYAQIAEVMGISPQTVANQLSAALAALRDRLHAFLPTRTRVSAHPPAERS